MRRFASRRSLKAAIVVLICLGQPVLSAERTEIDFNRDVRPIFTAHCLECHGGVKQSGDVSLIYPEQVLPPDGWVLEPGDPEASSLFDRVTSRDPELRMPPVEHGRGLTDAEIEVLRAWIEQGARWRRHWSLEPPRAPPLPPVQETAWPRKPLDHFVLARLEKAGLAPSAEASPRRWLRRTSLDLIGLPPTPEELATFIGEVDSRGDAAYDRAVDRLLQSPHFGERWASVWLDQVRYADSRGLGADGRRTIWKYRDWVIRAFDNDLPYDQFTIKQIAGDLLPGAHPEDLIATACHRLTQTNEEGGTDDEEFRVAAVIDRVNTTWQAWMGVTFGCVQCHSHPYDPFRHEEYYKFAAFFNNTVDCDLNEDFPLYAAPIDPADYDQATSLDRKIDQLRNSIWTADNALLTDEGAWKPLTKLQPRTNNATRVEVEHRDGYVEYRTVGTVSQNTDIAIESDLPRGLDRLTAVRVTALPLDPGRAVPDSEWGFVWSHVTAELVVPGEAEPRELTIARVVGDQPEPLLDPQASLDGKHPHGFAAYSRINYPRQAALVVDPPQTVPTGSRLRVTLAHRVFMLGAYPLVTRRGRLDVSSDLRWTEQERSPELQAQRNRLAEFAAARSKIQSVPTPVMRERLPQFARPTHVFERGLFLDKGAKVDAGVPNALPALKSDRPADRLALGNWLGSRENPLTARVAVNRMWARLFGQGLVLTEEDFGSSGEPPTHPELLDHLATRFQNELGWSQKQLLREIVLSATYRQSAAMTPQMLAADPSNRLLGRGPRHRLSAEMVRDQALLVAGLLNRKKFGPPVHPPIPEGVWRPFSADTWATGKPGEPHRYRRSIYTYVKRSIPYPMFAAFDQPSREFCAPRRLRSNTPLQALETLNSETFVECIRALAATLEGAKGTLAERLASGFERVTCRPPAEDELQVLVALHKDNPDDRAMRAVAAALLNLDEVMMK